MQTCCTHVEDDPDPQRARCRASTAQGARGAGGPLAFGLLPRRARTNLGASHARRAARATCQDQSRGAPSESRRADPRRSRVALIVIDASALVELVLQTPAGQRVASRVGSSALHAPHVVDLEVTSALRSLERLGMVTLVEAQRALTDYLDLEVTRYALDLLL